MPTDELGANLKPEAKASGNGTSNFGTVRGLSGTIPGGNGNSSPKARRDGQGAAAPTAKSAETEERNLRRETLRLLSILSPHARQLKDETFKSYARNIGLNAEQFDACLKSNRYDAAISADVTEANKQGITGTPTFVVGRTTDDMIEGTIIGGAQPIEAFRTQIEPLLKQDKRTQAKQ